MALIWTGGREWLNGLVRRENKAEAQTSPNTSVLLKPRASEDISLNVRREVESEARKRLGFHGRRKVTARTAGAHRAKTAEQQ